MKQIILFVTHCEHLEFLSIGDLICQTPDPIIPPKDSQSRDLLQQSLVPTSMVPSWLEKRLSCWFALLILKVVDFHGRASSHQWWCVVRTAVNDNPSRFTISSSCPQLEVEKKIKEIWWINNEKQGVFMHLWLLNLTCKDNRKCIKALSWCCYIWRLLS